MNRVMNFCLETQWEFPHRVKTCAGFKSMWYGVNEELSAWYLKTAILLVSMHPR